MYVWYMIHESSKIFSVVILSEPQTQAGPLLLLSHIFYIPIGSNKHTYIGSKQYDTG